MIKMQLIGNVGKDPQVKEGDNGKIVYFSVAAMKQNKTDENEPTIWVNVIANGKLAEVCEQYVKKGAMLFVDGAMTRNSKGDSLAIYLSDMKILQNPRPQGAYKKPYSKPQQNNSEDPF